MAEASSDTPDATVILYTTWPDPEGPARAAAVLLEERLIACANVLSPMVSVFRWEGEVQTEDETPVLFKTSRARAEETSARLLALHPYDEPCVLAISTERALSAPGFTGWVAEETRP